MRTVQPACIVGAGLSGLIAGYAWPAVPIFEAAFAPVQSHKAVLRFRSDAVARLTGIEFRPVMVRKGVFDAGIYSDGVPTIAAANRYARKVTGAFVGDRSIWNLSPVQRYIAPPDFYERLVEHCGARITWACPVRFETNAPELPIVSTAPLPEVLETCGIDATSLNFQRASISVLRYRIRNADLYQTVYFPDDAMQLYRASITGDLLILELMNGAHAISAAEHAAIDTAFGGIMQESTFLDRSYSQYGKIVELPAAARKATLFKLTHEKGIYSLGRFACWRNILLDDVVNDIAVVKRLMATDGSRYELAKARAS